jgi:hypothetical protein
MIVKWLNRVLCTAGAGIAVVSVVACGSSVASGGSAVPAEFRAACGHPGAHVMARKVPVTVFHAACDLSGVLITYRNYVGATVPRGDGGTTIGNSSGLTLTIQPASLDVTINATGVPGDLQHDVGWLSARPHSPGRLRRPRRTGSAGRGYQIRIVTISGYAGSVPRQRLTSTGPMSSGPGFVTADMNLH